MHFKKNTIVVILPIYIGNNLKDFRLAIRSLLRQSVCVDIMIGCDGPIENELANYIAKMSLRYSNIIVYSLECNSGLANILNRCVDKSLELGYDFIGRMDGDDFSVKNRFRIQHGYLMSNPDCHAVGSQLIIFNSYSRLRMFKSFRINFQSLFDNFIYNCPLPHPGVLFRSTFFSDIRYSDQYYLNEDYHLWLQAFEKNKLISNISEPLLFFREDQAIYGRRTGLRVALSDLRIRFSFMSTFSKYTFFHILFSIAFFLIKLFPVRFINFLVHFVKKYYI